MSLRHLLRMLLNNEQLIQKISESYPVRRAAQLTTYFFHRGKELGEDTFEKMKNSDLRNRMQQEMDLKKDQAKSTVDRTNSFVNRFSSILIEEWKKVEKKLEEEKQKSIEEKKKDR